MTDRAPGRVDYELDDVNREKVYLLGDALIPEHSSGPSADEAGVAGVFIDEVLSLRPDKVTDFLAVIAPFDVDNDPATFCRSLETDDPGAFQTLTLIIAGAYLLSPKSRQWLQYDGQKGQMQDGSPQDDYGPGGLLDAVRERGPIYRPTDWVSTRGEA